MKKIMICVVVFLMGLQITFAQKKEVMEKQFRSIEPMELSENAISMIGKEWLLITAGKKSDFNTMTASWGTLGFLWNEPVAMIFVRPQRHTFAYMEKEEYFTLTVFAEEYRDILQYCGSHSGRDVNKVKETGLIPLETALGNIYFKQARLVLECKKVFVDDLREDAFLEKRIVDKTYPKKDFHRMYVGKIVNAWIEE